MFLFVGDCSVLGGSELLWWGFVEPLYLMNWHRHLGRNMIKYVFCVRANQERAQNTSLQLYLSMCGPAPCKMLTSTKLSLKAESQQQNAAVG